MPPFPRIPERPRWIHLGRLFGYAPRLGTVTALAAFFVAGPALAGVLADRGLEVRPGPEGPEGYLAVESDALPERLTEVFADSAFSIRIDRSAASEADRRMIERTERLLPSAEHLDAILEAGHQPLMDMGNWPNRLQAARALAEAEGPRWWFLEWDHVLLPMALSAPAVHHYTSLLRARAVSPNPFGPEAHRGHLAYAARVEAVEGEQAAETPFVVILDLHLYYWCGGRCSLEFRHDRRVYFDASGEPVRVEGDRIPRFAVS